ETPGADMPLRFIAIKLDETALFQRRQQPMERRGRQTGADRKIAQPVSLIVFSERFEYRERAVHGLYATIPGIGIAVRVGFRLDEPAPDHVFLHRDLHSSVCGKTVRCSAFGIPFV